MGKISTQEEGSECNFFVPDLFDTKDGEENYSLDFFCLVLHDNDTCAIIKH